MTTNDDQASVKPAADASFETLTCAEPMLSALEAVAKAVRAEPGKPFCANKIWYAGLKPLMVHFIGRARGYPPNPAKDPASDGWERIDIAALMAKDKDEGRAPAEGNQWEEFLRTSDAFDIAYKHRRRVPR
jgi:hypothetical protein